MPSATIEKNNNILQDTPSYLENKSALDLFNLKGKVVSITGASSGIGFEVAIAVAQAGAHVAMWYNSHPIEKETMKLISSKYGVICKSYKCQVTDYNQVDNTIRDILNDFGKIDVMIANAGVSWDKGGILDIPSNKDAALEWKKIMDVDLNSMFYVARSVGKVFRKQKQRGSFIMTASMSGHIVNVPQNQAAYNAAKAGVLQLSKSLAVEWSKFARVNTISPGYTQSALTDALPTEWRDTWNKLTPMGRLAYPKELVGAYIYLASDASTFTTGADIVIDGGYTCV
ncbi:related to Sorbose reductase homolog SOU2 [Saccharomycodes ludwigii]|uniref:Related to Sorbose reductase homolog SOU2 n=1 Tax=Saccharomycodes ludwigii TaxID=36035 RepID=A0A376B3Y1_9ASCO|nr:hypothetical protein SCDLUD_005287 [Saccharomycodes ludwigii]KAH3898940.1 hypothetical protein SCDLUD_005287 [Saccharomycodes ludwigii]SSD59396.1 related to Sorbose reductase homolog SOU2 [Saccharomycodes ludwigii]